MKNFLTKLRAWRTERLSRVGRILAGHEASLQQVARSRSLRFTRQLDSIRLDSIRAAGRSDRALCEPDPRPDPVFELESKSRRFKRDFPPKFNQPKP